MKEEQLICYTSAHQFNNSETATLASILALRTFKSILLE